MSKKLDPFSGSGIPIPYPYIDINKAVKILTDPKLYKGWDISKEEAKAIVSDYKRQYIRLTKMLEAADHTTHGLNGKVMVEG